MSWQHIVQCVGSSFCGRTTATAFRCHDDRLLGVILSAAKNLDCYAGVCNQAEVQVGYSPESCDVWMMYRYCVDGWFCWELFVPGKAEAAI